MPSYFRLQDLTTVDDTGGNTVKQDIEEAIDVGAFKTLVVQLRLPVASTAATSATLYLQHAAVKEEDAFVDYPTTTFDLKGAANQVQTYSNCLRFVRWKIVFAGAAGTDPRFLIEIVARES